MTIRGIVLGAAAALVVGACAPGPRAGGPLVASRAPRRALLRGAQAEFGPARFQDVFASAVELMHERGVEIATCDADRGRLVTAPVELDAPCWGTTCLARQTTHVKLGYRRARVTLAREVWDPTLRAWRTPDDPSSVEEIAREERELLDRMVAPNAAGVRRPRPDPCVAGHCRDGICVATTAAPAP